MTERRRYHYSMGLVWSDVARYMSAGGVRMILHVRPRIAELGTYEEIVWQPASGSRRICTNEWRLMTPAEEYAVECHVRRWAHRCRDGADGRAGRERRMQDLPWHGPERRSGSDRRLVP